MKLSLIAYKCNINPPRKNFNWRQFLANIVLKIYNKDRSTISELRKSYSREELNTLVTTVQSFSDVELEAFIEELVKLNIQVLHQKSGVRMPTNTVPFPLNR